MSRILVTGSRDWTDAAVISNALHAAFTMHNREPMTVVHGGARGADQLAGAVVREWAGRYPLSEEVYLPDWDTHGRKAGFLRNRIMVRTGADLCLAFIKNESRGATMCAELAEAAGIPVLRFVANGE